MLHTKKTYICSDDGFTICDFTNIFNGFLWTTKCIISFFVFKLEALVTEHQSHATYKEWVDHCLDNKSKHPFKYNSMASCGRQNVSLASLYLNGCFDLLSKQWSTHSLYVTSNVVSTILSF
jgi:hypothetical protein